MTTSTQGWTAEDLANDVNVVALWTTVDKVRWAAGIISGWIAAAIAFTVGGIIAVAHGYQFLFPVKLMGTILVGRSATEYSSTAGLIAGIFVIGFIMGLWGFVYGHFVRSNSKWAFLGMGFTWGSFLWVFNWNLLLHSFKNLSAAEIPSSAAVAVCMAYGFGMAVIGIVDPMLRGRR